MLTRWFRFWFCTTIRHRDHLSIDEYRALIRRGLNS